LFYSQHINGCQYLQIDTFTVPIFSNKF
jgi:hypothetical protein